VLEAVKLGGEDAGHDEDEGGAEVAEESAFESCWGGQRCGLDRSGEGVT
jgi:hypothetical protein